MEEHSYGPDRKLLAIIQREFDDEGNIILFSHVDKDGNIVEQIENFT